uniref:sphinganine-1-phosphate aldolase n=1 Tax=Meloidogyne javanica TaxID=6303 RepID=A0A915LIB7_MELJA
MQFNNNLFPDVSIDKASKINFMLVGVSIAGTWFVIYLHELVTRSPKPLIKSINKQIEEALNKTKEELIHSIHQYDKGLDFIREMPLKAINHESILKRIEYYQEMEGTFDYIKGRVSGTVYTNIDPTHMSILGEVFHKFAYSNPLHPDVFPAVRKMEAEIIKIVASLFHGPEDAVGTVTTGGTESIILACLAARNFAFSKGINDPIIIVPVTAHAAFDKACSLLQIGIKHIPCDPITMRVDLKAMKRAINRKTCLLVGSAPNFPYGTIDDIPSIAQLGLDYSIPVHVDACLGGFVLAFSQDSPALSHIPIFDFRLPGVTSISCDTHKYGYAPKGTSTIIYRSTELLHHQYFAVTEWPGSRAGLNIALTWSTLLYFGRQGYIERANLIATRTAQLADGIHFCLTYNQSKGGVIIKFLNDLRECCKQVCQLPDKGKNSKTAALYGMAAQIPDKTIIEDVAHLYLDACYSMPTKA